MADSDKEPSPSNHPEFGFWMFWVGLVVLTVLLWRLRTNGVFDADEAGGIGAIAIIGWFFFTSKL